MKERENPYQWGYAIYRTVYTPQSDELWPSVLEKLETYMELGCNDEDYRDELQNVVVWDREKFNQASIDEVRNDFKREMLIPEMGEDDFNSDDDSTTRDRKLVLYYQKIEELTEEYGEEALFGEVNFQFCLLIDDEVFQSILNAPEPAEGRELPYYENKIFGFVKLVTLYESSERIEDWPGWGKVDFRILWWTHNADEIERQARQHDGVWLITGGS